MLFLAFYLLIACPQKFLFSQKNMTFFFNYGAQSFVYSRTQTPVAKEEKKTKKTTFNLGLWGWGKLHGAYCATVVTGSWMEKR